MGNCDFRSTTETGEKDMTLDQERNNAKSSVPIVQENQNDVAPIVDNYEYNNNEENELNSGQKEITFNNNANDPSVPANIQSEGYDYQRNGDVDVDQVIYIESKERNYEDNVEKENFNKDDSLEFECSANYNVELTNKKKTENFKVEHPLKTHGIDNFKKGFKNKILKDIVVESN